jgi:hypothetical protein
MYTYSGGFVPSRGGPGRESSPGVTLLKAVAGVLTVCVAVWGAYTGTVSWLDARKEVVNLSVSGSATLNSGILDLSGIILGVQDASQRPVFISHAELLDRGQRLADIDLMNPSDTQDQTQSQSYDYLPLAVQSGASAHFAVQAADQSSRLDSLIAVWERRTPQISVPWFSPTGDPKTEVGKLQLAVDFSGIGWRVVSIPVEGVPMSVPLFNDRDASFVGTWHGDLGGGNVAITVPKKYFGTQLELRIWGGRRQVSGGFVRVYQFCGDVFSSHR